MGIFSTNLVDQHTVDWQFEHYEALIKNFSTGSGLPEAELRLPSGENFRNADDPDKTYEGHALAMFLLERIMDQCGITNVAVTLTPTSEIKPEHIGGAVILQTENKNAAAGRYVVEKGEDGKYRETITYDEDLVEYPVHLIATLAHELAHLLHNRAQELPEFEAEILYEMFTDLTAVYMGYGVFLANSRFTYETDGEMFRTSSKGYLPESELIFATAIFMKIKGISTDITKPYLKKHLQKMLSKAMKQLAKYPREIQHLCELKPFKIKTD